MSQSKILIADDDKDTCRYIEQHLAILETKEDLQVSIDFAYDRDSALAYLEQNSKQPYDLAIVDLWMPDASGVVDREAGLKILERCKKLKPNPAVIIITGYSSSNSALRAMGLGAVDYIQRPIDYTALMAQVKQTLEIQKLKVADTQTVGDAFDEYEIIGSSKAMIEVMKQVGQIAQMDADVFIYGASGTGKELIAHAIHKHSPRKNGPFRVVNCTAFPKEQVEAELFGIARKAATQVDPRPGKFLEASGGTLFLDEIGEMDIDIQPKLLRAIEQKEIQGIGKEVQQVDVRIIAATNRNLTEAIAKGLFRDDLYYRLSGFFTIHLPLLRDRESDIQRLANYFLRKYAQRFDKNYIYGFEEDMLTILTEYPWPGNVRELEKDIQYAVVTCKGKFISPDDLPLKFRTSHTSIIPNTSDTQSITPNTTDIQSYQDTAIMRQLLDIDTLKEAKEHFEKLFLEWKLKRNDWNIKSTARQLDTSRKNLHKKIKDYGLQRNSKNM